eukprot:Colp12_sorted_trinity150504_noHs@17717
MSLTASTVWRAFRPLRSFLTRVKVHQPVAQLRNELESHVPAPANIFRTLKAPTTFSPISSASRSWRHAHHDVFFVPNPIPSFKPSMSRLVQKAFRPRYGGAGFGLAGILGLMITPSSPNGNVETELTPAVIAKKAFDPELASSHIFVPARTLEVDLLITKLQKDELERKYVVQANNLAFAQRVCEQLTQENTRMRTQVAQTANELASTTGAWARERVQHQQHAQELEARIDRLITCVCCLENERQIAYGCGHHVVCGTCDEVIREDECEARRNRCPMCRTEISLRLKLFAA